LGLKKWFRVEVGGREACESFARFMVIIIVFVTNASCGHYDYGALVAGRNEATHQQQFAFTSSDDGGKNNTNLR
jgi:hypothetical protein